MNRPEITITLPVPPSVNGLYATVGRRRIKTRAYRRWLREAGWQIKLQRQGCLGGPWEAHIVLPATLRGDADNRLKPLLDALVLSGAVADDRYCNRITVEKIGQANEVLVTLRAADRGDE